MTQDVRVRFAPSPTGNLHIGGARTAIYNWAFARCHGGTFILRIEDTDPERSTPENTQQIIRALTWLGLSWDEGPEVGGAFGPYLQTERFATYAQALERLKERGAVYPCFCTPELLDTKRALAQAEKRSTGYDRTCRGIAPEEAAARIAAGEPHTWRLALPQERQTVQFDDLVFGLVSVPVSELDDFILLRSNGSPTYNFVVCVDDALMKISHVIRGNDHLSNTPKQILIYEALGVPVPAFAHLSMILGGDGKRLSKRHGAASVEAYRDEGMLSDALVNYLSLLGWSLDGETTLISRETLAGHFELGRVSKNPAIFDPEKLAWMNQMYLKGLGAEAFVDAWGPFAVAEGLTTPTELAQRRSWFEAIYPLVVERVHTLGEVNSKVASLFGGGAVLFDEQSVAKGLTPLGSRNLLLACTQALAAPGLAWLATSLEAALRALPERLDVKPRVLFQALRVAITGQVVSLPLFESMELIGREACLQRLERALDLAG